MKILCFILSLQVFYLSIVPCCWDDNCNDEIKTEQTENHSNDKQEDGCNACSPFLTCGTCSGFVFSKLVFYFNKAQFSKSKFIAIYEPQFADDFFAKIWQPPKNKLMIKRGFTTF